MAYQAPPSMGFSRQEYWSGVPLPSDTQLKAMEGLSWVQWLRLHASIGGTGLIPGWRTKIPHVLWHSQKKRSNENSCFINTFYVPYVIYTFTYIKGKETNVFCYLLLLLLSCFSRVRLCATPWTTAHQTSPSMEFSRQEHWSGLPFPSPMHESGK